MEGSGGQLLPFGGVLIVDELGTTSTREELIVALAGPLQHVWMILVAMMMKSFDIGSGSWWDYFIEANLDDWFIQSDTGMPLDGGKVMQGLLGYMMSYHSTIVYSVWISIVSKLLDHCYVLISTCFRDSLPINFLSLDCFFLCPIGTPIGKSRIIFFAFSSGADSGWDSF